MSDKAAPQKDEAIATPTERERKLRIALRTLATVTTTAKAMRQYAATTLKEIYGQSNREMGRRGRQGY